jgi:hypothetical protein
VRDKKRPYDKTVALLASMHGKQRIIGPLLERCLGALVLPAVGLDADRFGTFSRDIARDLPPLVAARAKIAAAFCAITRRRHRHCQCGQFRPSPRCARSVDIGRNGRCAV